MHFENIIKEACVTTLPAALHAAQHRASRIELCTDLSCGGLTPSKELTTSVIDQLGIPVHVMVRPRPGNFTYTSEEIMQMQTEIDWIKASGAAGVVFGFLCPDHEVDLALTQQLTQYAYPMKVTFHRAIDESRHLLKAVESLVSQTNITSILCSGGSGNPMNHIPLLREANRKCLESNVELIICGGVTWENLAEIHRTIGASAYHGTRIVGEM